MRGLNPAVLIITNHHQIKTIMELHGLENN